MCEAFRRMGANAVGLEISRGAIEYAVAHFPKCDFYCESLFTFASRGLKFDFIYTSEVLEHLPGPDEFICAVEACSRPGTLVYVSAPDAGHHKVPSNLADWTDICPPEHLQWFDAANLEHLFAPYGFRLFKRWQSRTPSHQVMFQKL